MAPGDSCRDGRSHENLPVVKIALAVVATVALTLVGPVPRAAAVGSFDGTYSGVLNYQANTSQGTNTGSAPIGFSVTNNSISGQFGPVPLYGTVNFSGTVDASGAALAGAAYGCALSAKLSASGAGSGSITGCNDQGGTASGSFNFTRTAQSPTSQPRPVNPTVNTHLPASGIGYYSYCTTSERLSNGECRYTWGTPKLIYFVTKLATGWNERHPGLPLGIGDLSQQGGGQFGSHTAGHKSGQEADIRAIRVNWQRCAKTQLPADCATSFQGPDYSRSLTKELVEEILATKPPSGLNIYVIFNDSKIPNICHDRAGKPQIHNDHLHLIVDPRPLDTKRFKATGERCPR